MKEQQYYVVKQTCGDGSISFWIWTMNRMKSGCIHNARDNFDGFPLWFILKKEYNLEIVKVTLQEI